MIESIRAPLSALTRRCETFVRSPGRMPQTTAAWLVSRTRQLPGVRWDVVARVKRQIDAGTYDTPERLDIAVERMLERWRP